MNTITRANITTFTGRVLDLMNPQEDAINIVDIAHHLSQVCRWAGATNQFYSVAQHSVFVSFIVPEYLQQWALMHDAAEAYIGDITRPLKNLIPAVRPIEARIMRVIANKYQLAWPEPPQLCEYDDQAIRFEAETVMRQHSGIFAGRGKDEVQIQSLLPHQKNRVPRALFGAMTPNASKTMFGIRFQELFPEQDNLFL